jgi:hypothetical protein
MSQDYTANADIVRGSRWPPADDNITIQITKSSGWPASADSWTWTMVLSRTTRGGTADLEIEADSASVDGNVLTLTFHATSAETAALPAGKGRYYVEVKSDDGADGVSYYDCVAGTANVRDAAGEG